ncbi:N/A [soil metagenome]
MTRWGAERLVVRYGATTAVDRVSFGAGPGEVTALVGGDGAGKTSALRALVGLVPAAGGVLRRPPKRDVGYLSAGPGAYPDLTVDENLAFAGSAYGLTGRRLVERRDELLAGVGLADARDRLGGRLSGGMRRKLALACALLHRPSLLVLDEPTTGVDSVSRAELWRLLTRAAAAGAAVVLSTTYVDEAERAGRVVALEAGRPLLAGPPGELVAGVQGRLWLARRRPPAGLAWRHGRGFRVYDGRAPSDAVPAAATLEDAVIVAALGSTRATGEPGVTA